MASPTTMPPPPPRIQGEAMLEIFVHRSIRFPGAPLNTETAYGDADRLTAIGSKILEAAYVSILFDRRPLLNAADLETEFGKLAENVDRWVAGYRWKEKVRHGQDVDLNTPEESRNIMNAYVGAVFLGDGFSVVSNWIAALVGYSAALQQDG
ncbi:hypothetical protein V8D89_002645 [Ganoderma adspersum]